jgi:hypothetical protein
MKNKFINENTYLDASNDFVKELEKSKILADNIDVSVGPSQWGKPGELRFRDHVTLRAAGIETELYVIPRGSYTEFELYTDTGYDTGREVKVGDAKTIIKAMKRYVNKMNESMVDEASQDAYSLHRLGDNLGQETAEEFLSNNNVDLKLLTKAIQQKTISKYELRDVVKGTAHKSKIKNFMKEFVKESVNEARVKLPKGILKHKDIPTWAEWVAQHSDGEWTWYESYPNVVNFKDGGGAWKQEYPDGMQIYTEVKTDPKNWKEGPYRVRYDGDVVLESVVNEETHKTIAIEDSILQGIAEYLETTKGKLFKVINYDKRAAKDLSDLAKHLKPILDNWDEYGKVEEKLTQTFGDYLKDLDDMVGDGHKAAMGDNGGEQLENRQTALHNLRLFGNYIKSLLKEYGKDKTRLTFTYESRNVMTLESFVNEGKVDWNIIAKEVANRLKEGSWPWAIKNGVENITTENIGSVLISGGYTTTSGVEKNIGGVIDKVLALVKESFLNEELPTQEIDPAKFQNPYKSDKNFFKRGYKDKEVMDDVVKTKPVKIQASQLKPSQDAVYLGKALGMAIGGVEGGNLEAVISQDNRILDGHHRWAATIFNNPKARVGGVQAELKIGDLVPVLRQAGDALGNKRGLPPKGGDQNIFKATLDDVKDAIYDGKYMNPQFYNRDKAIAWFEEQGEKKIQSALNLLQRVGPPGGAPPRADMPKIEPEQVQQVAKKLQGGAIDVRAPYVKEELNHLTSLESFIDEKKPGPDPYMTDLSKDDEEDKEEQMKKQADMDDDDPNAYKDMPGDKEAREKGDMKKSKHTSAYHKKFKKVKSLEEFANDWAVIKEGYNADAVAQNVVVALDSAAQFFPRYQPAEAEAEVKDVLKKYKKLKGKNAEKAAKEIRNSLEDRGLLANDVLPLDVEIIIMDNLNESVNEAANDRFLQSAARNLAKQMRGKSASRTTLKNRLNSMPLASRLKPDELEKIIDYTMEEMGLAESVNEGKFKKGQTVKYIVPGTSNKMKSGKITDFKSTRDEDFAVIDGKTISFSNISESVNEGTDDVVFTIDDGNLDDKFLMTRSLSRNLDYQNDSGDQYYVLPKRDFDRLEDYADSHGYDADSIYVIEESVNEEKDNLYLQLHRKYAEQIKGLKAKKIKKLTDLVSVQRWSMEDREDYFDMDKKKKKELSAEYDEERRLFKKYMAKDYSVMLPKGTEILRESVNEEKDQTNDKSKIDGEGIETGLKKKAEESGVPIGIIRVIMRRGMAAWKSGHRPGTNSTQWGYARVNSFLTKGDGTWGKADKDMAKEVRDGGHDKKL